MKRRTNFTKNKNILVPVIFAVIAKSILGIYFILATELLNIVGPDHAGPVPAPGYGHLPHLAPGQGGEVKHDNGG